ncbi:MAG: acetyl-CoA decarbonylase/synthase complex subunit gamma [Candidatus Omnitrophota bacterium]
MALSGLDIYKLLPKTNCKKCGFQTCLAFAMQLAKKAVALDKCPFVSGEVRVILEAASQPAIRLVEIGAGEQKVLVGNETVLFRHEEKFYHPTAIGFIIEDDKTPIELENALDEVLGLSFERVGQRIGVELIALREKSPNKEQFVKMLNTIVGKTQLGLVIMPASIESLKLALEICAGRRPLVYCSEPTNMDGFISICKEYKVPLSFKAKCLDDFSQASKKALQQGVGDLVFHVSAENASERLWQLTQIRRLSIKKNERSLGFPTMVIIEDKDESQAVSKAAGHIVKYASIVLLRTRKPEYILPLLTLRQNIFTDPQKPLQVEPKVYPVGLANDRSPVIVTTNFSLTYYTVLGEIESSRVPTHLICLDTEGMSVLTAWAAEKFTPERITDTLIKFKLSDIVKHKNLIIPGYVAMMSGDLEEKSGWNVLVGPREAAGLPSFLKGLSTT